MDIAICVRSLRLSRDSTGPGARKVIPLLIATQNKAKYRELQQLISDLPFALMSLEDVPKLTPVPETGTTFVENAILKAAGYAIQSSLLTLADDSGLEVDALGGAPGVFSARYSGEGATDKERVDKVLYELSNVGASNRSARFLTAVALAAPTGRILNVSVGTCNGRIGTSSRG